MNTICAARTTYGGLVGRTDDGSRVTVAISLETPQHSTVTTINHAVLGADDTMLTFSAMGDVYEKGKREPGLGGQCLDALLEVTEPAPGWTLDDLQNLHEIWRRWHLNSMNAACAHMDRETLVWEATAYGSRIACGQANRCPVSDYTYGAAWLYEPLPAVTLDEIVRLQRKLVLV